MIPRFLSRFPGAALALCLSGGVLSAQEPEVNFPLWENSPVPPPQHGQVLQNGQQPSSPIFGMPSPPRMEGRSVPAAISEEIQELAASLGNDPLRIFNYVRNTIDYEQYFGAVKGPELTLLEGSGNDLDTCSLLSALLKAAGHTNHYYVYQARYVPVTGNGGNNATEWMGLSEAPYGTMSYQDVFGTPNPYPVDDLTAKKMENAYAFVDNRKADMIYLASNLPGIVMGRFWIQLVYEGNTYNLDPSFKRYEKISGIDLAAACGYLTTGQDRAALLSAAGGTTGTGYVQAMSRANINSFLSARTADLLQLLTTSHPNATVEEIVNGRRIIKRDASDLNQAYELPAGDAYGVGSMIWWYEIPPPLKSTIRFQSGDIDHTVPFSDLKGAKVSLAATGNEVQLWIDDQKVDTTTVTATSYNLTTTVQHYLADYPSFGETKPYLKGDDYVYAIIYGCNASQKFLEKRYDQLEKALEDDPSGNGREARSEALNVVGLNWLHQTALVRRLVARRYGVSHYYRHRVGRVGQEEGYYIDVALQQSSDQPEDGLISDGYFNALHIGSLFASAMEHGIIEQMQPGKTAVSTVNVLRIANDLSAGDKRIYVINQTLVNSPTGWNAAKADLAAYDHISTKNGRYDTRAEDYTDTNANGQWDPGEPYTDATELGQFKFFAENGGTVIVPKNREVTQSGWNWSGSAWILRGDLFSGMLIGGLWSGGYAAFSDWFVPAPVSSWGLANPSFTYSAPSYGYTMPSYSFMPTRLFGSDPVDMATGAFTLTSEDLKTGMEEAPRSLSFSRQYSSNINGRDKQNLGHGWTHSLDIRAFERTASEEALGLGNPRQAAAFLTAMTIGSDLYRRTGATAKEWVMAPFVMGWYVDQLTNNAVTVQIGDQQQQFIKRPDGSYEPPTGSTMTLVKNGTAPNHTYTLTQRLGNQFTFEKAEGSTSGGEQRIKEIADPDGKKMTFTYLTGASMDQINQVTDAVGRKYTFTYDANKRITKVTDSSDAREIGFAYDADGNLITSTDPEGKNTHYDYADPSTHRITKHRNHDNQTITENIYDSSGRVSEQYLHGDPTKKYTLRYTGVATTEENPAGGVTTYYYDDRGRATATRDAKGNVESWKHDGQDHIIEKTTGSGEITTYAYDANHNLVRVDHPRGGGSTHMVYDSLGRLNLLTDPDGNQTDYVYSPGNTKARPNQVIDAGGTITYTYMTSGPAIGRVWKIKDADNLETEYLYDNTTGQPKGSKAPGGFETKYNFSLRGDLLDTTDPNGIKTTYLYNTRRQVTKTTVDATGPGAGQSVTDVTYDNQGNPASTLSPTDQGIQRNKSRQEYSATNKVRFARTSGNDGIEANDPTVETEYDGRDWQSLVRDPLSRVTSFTPYPNGELQLTTLPLGRATETEFDGDGRAISTTVPGSASGPRTTTVSYGTSSGGYPQTIVTTPDELSVSETQDRSGRTRFYTNRKNDVWEFRYDGLGRRTHVITPLDAAASRAAVTQYHHRGMVKKITEPSGQVIDFTYHTTNGRLTTVADSNPATYTINHTAYDDNGNLLTTTETRGGPVKTTNRTYDRQNRLASRTDENGQTIGYRHYPSGKLAKIIYPGGSDSGTGHVEYTWWPGGQLKEVIDKLDSTTSPRITSYFWNKDGKLAKVQRHNGTVREVKYDAAGRPEIIEEYGPGMKLIFVHKQGYHASDEMAWRYTLPAKRTSGNDPPTMLAMTYNADNQLATWNGLAVTHDADGNMTSGPAPDGETLAGYSYDTRNRLVSALDVSYSYDADGHRVNMVHGTDTTSFVTDVSSRLSKLLVRTKNGVSTRYVWGLGLLYEVNVGGATTSYHHDASGSTIALSDDDGKVVERIGYTPWGQINYRSNLSGTPHDTPFLFTGFFGNQTDASGLLFMRARYYHPRIGRFLNADPAQEGMNWYGYAGGNPAGMVDPMGLGIESALDSVQSVLSFLGMTPVFGAVFDIVNTAISIGRGNYVDAGINFISAIPGFGDFVGGAKLAVSGYNAAASIGGGFASSSFSFASHSIGYRTPVQAYDVGSFSGLKSASIPGDRLDIHHAGQAHPMGQIISGYDRFSAPAIAVPRAEHVRIPTIKGVYEGSARDLLANDIRNLRNFTKAPNSALQELIALNKKMFPDAFRKP